MKRYKLFSLLCVVIFGGCSYLDDYSQDLVVAKTVEHLDELMIGSCYFQSKNIRQMGNGEVAWFLNILDDDVTTVAIEDRRAGTITEMNNQYYGYTTWQYEVGRSWNKSSLRDDAGTWNALYQHINAVNIVLSELDKIDIPTEEEAVQATRMRGECHFLRAQFYFLLVNLYGNAYEPSNAAQTLGVPLKLTEYVEHDKDKNTQFERATVAAVYEQVVRDLTDAITYLKEGGDSRSIFRVSSSAAELLLSRVYLYMQDWENAGVHAANVIKDHALMNYATVAADGYAVSEESPEVLFSQGSLNIMNNVQGIGGDFGVSYDLYSLYLDEDYRKQLYFTTSYNVGDGTITNADSLALRKYNRSLDRSYVSDIFTLRVAEAYLNAAEAYAMQGKMQEASDLLNELRSNRIMNYVDRTYPDVALVQHIRDERRRELCFEGHRWFDLRRYAVCEAHPFVKNIVRNFAVYDANTLLLRFVELYYLRPNDPAYTFQIPKAVTEFDSGMEVNPREQRALSGYLDLDAAKEEGGEENVES